MTLTQPTLSKRKNPAVQPADEASDQDQPDPSEIECQPLDSLKSPDHKRPRLDEPPVSPQGVSTAKIPSEVAEGGVTLSQVISHSPPPATLADQSLSHLAEPPNEELAVSAPEDSALPATVPENSPEPTPRKDLAHDSDSNEPNVATTSKLPSEKPDWVPSILRDPSSETPRKLVQMTLSTSGASWNTKSRITHSSKGSSSHKKKTVSSSERMRNNIQRFTLGGGHAKPVQAQSDKENEEDERMTEADQLSQSDMEDELDAEPDQRNLQGASSPTPLEPLETSDDIAEETEQLQLPTSPASLALNHASSNLDTARVGQKPDVVHMKPQTSHSSTLRVVREKEVIPSKEPSVVDASVQLEDIVKAWEACKHRQSAFDTRTTSGGDSELQGAGLDQSEAEAETTLSRNVQKADFEHMEIIGQFNLGFIIVRRLDDKNSADDLFIVDQHASDEKFNFEKLQRETKLTGQRLLIPKVLGLTAVEEITVMEHLDILELNGFNVRVDESAGVGSRVQLLAQPVSGNTSWDVSDLEELLHLINERGSNEVVRPSKTRRMMASRACRMSTMIGDGLTTKQMSRIVTQMGTMDQPWACPHGRPTMRWLARCDENPRQTDPRYRISDWITGKLDS